MREHARIEQPMIVEIKRHVEPDIVEWTWDSRLLDKNKLSNVLLLQRYFLLKWCEHDRISRTY
jgi:hypothetical protein